MPYALPADHTNSPSSSTVTTTAAPRSHRRTRSSGNFSDERGPGAFVSLGTLPRSHKKAVFHLGLHDDDAAHDDDDDAPQPTPRPSLAHVSPHRSYLSPTNSLRLSMNNGRFSPSIEPPSRIDIPPPAPASVPFPTSSPSSPGGSGSPFFLAPSATTNSSPPTASLTRTPSTPIILSNGKPLKPSLKSSSSSPNIADALGRAATKHLRAQSAPSTPGGPKNVHFADKDSGLETVRVFSRSGKPASLSKPSGEETETETEAEGPNVSSGSNSFPFPSIASAELPLYEIDTSSGRTSSVPVPMPSPYANVHLETLALPRTRPPALRGTVLVRNIAFEKRVAVRFTLDDWQTTSEVTCRHVVSLPSLPPPFPHPRTVGDLAGSIASGDRAVNEDEGKLSWDRFSFTIRLEDYEHKLAERTLFLVTRYSPGCGGEWWDNNSGQNFRVGFRRAPSSPATHSQNFAGMGLGMGVGLGAGESHSQQRTFSAPSTLRTTPTSGALAQAQEGPEEGENTSANARMVALAKAQVESVRQMQMKSKVYAPQLMRSASNPLPTTPPADLLSVYAADSRSSSVPNSPVQGYINKRLSLSNYVAPGSASSASSMVTPPLTPPNGGSGRVRSSSLPVGVGLSADVPSKESEVPIEEEDEDLGDSSALSQEANILSPDTITGGQPVTALEPLDFKLPWTGPSGFGAHMGTGLGIEFPVSASEVPSQTQEQLLSPPRSPSHEQASLGLGLDVGEQGRQASSAYTQHRTALQSTISISLPSLSSGSSSPASSGASTPALRDPTYAALIRNWCFTGSPTGAPVGRGTAVAAPPVSYGFPAFGSGFGMMDAGMVGGRSVASVRAALCVRSLFNAAPLCGDMLLASTSWVAARVRLPPPEYVHPALPRISPQGLHTTGLAYPYPRPLLPNSTIPIAAHDLS
ncbi:hypothetical protein IEO21_02417 [Rhodonia placenta]|uniref:CBM21 domain-containing protein n=1 Tax=Rhodonia placenta TaxID=104341 RepID=A0A8H7P7U0_9APHY|nr:hypothetical protein IEO21_02417 [Postia placenta]